MSCGNHHETDCSEVLAEVWLFLDQECDERRKQLLQTHLEECHPCLEEYGLEEHLKALLAKKCGGEHAPEDLKNRLRARIHQTTTTGTETTVVDVEVDVQVTVTTTD
ncbi:mycothiol system anti-sigma-R factor [Actinosynnema sp. NPDC020468]|uniref:mycothiol system anti-sigma-R factor n=1 Tax=Actinosynnema sp. NPDC020468 TaxID=3154488 RepID=UPI003403E885